MIKNNSIKKLGVIGGGQLAQMLATAAEPLGIEVHAWVTDLNCPAKNNAWIATGDTPDDFQYWLENLDALTFEFENVDLAPLEKTKLSMYPRLQALRIAQDRALEKNFFKEHHIPTTTFNIVDSIADCKKIALEMELPVIIKTCREGYDGKGQAFIRTEADLEKLDQRFENKTLII
jgi:5-(carboxyamino)imidazole ribonucleotide synthase